MWRLSTPPCIFRASHLDVLNIPNSFLQGGQGTGGFPAVEKLEKELQQANENAKRSQEEMDRLLKLVQMSQEEQNAKEKQIHDMQM